ncbi:MAG: hypothetical protein M3483_08845 [Gemmatimonadota bacterium]|nr:hypothetical protein [Gemmatimonadota bacterium]MDQ3605381.1 hypothetical protein [Gemmatimonadota bacterium]
MAEITVERESNARSIDWSAAVWAGIVAGIVFMMMEMILAPMFGGAPSIWAPPRMIAAIGMGQQVLPPPADFALGPIMVAMVIHFMLSITFGIVTAFIVRNLSTGAAVLVGIVLAVLLYVLVFYLMTPVWPWFANARGWVSIVAHIAFGAVVGWWYRARAKSLDEHRVVT